MATTPRWWSQSVLAGLALGTLVPTGCASFGKSDPPALATTNSWEASSQPRPVLHVTGGNELEPRETVANRSEREKAAAPKAAAQRLTMKTLKLVDTSTKTISVGGGDLAGLSSISSGAVSAVAQPVPAVFAERRASEAFDRLAALVEIRHEKRGAVITLPSDRLVDSGQWTLTTSGQYTMRELAVGLREQGGRTIRIQAYTDSMGAPAANDALSLRRAEAVRDFLIAEGVPAESMRAEGMGAKRPLAPNGTADGRAQNRRIELVIAPLGYDGTNPTPVAR